MEFDTAAYSTTVTFKKHIEPEVIRSIQRLEIFTGPIKIEAVKIAYGILKDSKTKILKRTRKDKVVFYSIYMACYNEGTPVDADWLAKALDFPTKIVQEAFKDYLPPGDFFVSPRDLIPFFMKRLEEVSKLMIISKKGFNTRISEVLDTIENTDIGKRFIRNCEVKKVAIGTIMIVRSFYTFPEMTMEVCSKAFDETPQTIQTWTKKMFQIYNES